ncbi:hypothetical protein BOX15_Mlig014979g1 [Macrostomum lignano]|uniref:Uncharacterized protein n=1 Tax=Macrostomum lignano TaxID=282301 RepID=A0A267GHW3_9PLAT|nr:hypothetical protein BOX15_Mlig014979g1 [Macrostomum lignano]
MARDVELLTVLSLVSIFEAINASPPGLAHLYSDFYLSRTSYRYARPVVNNSQPVIMYMNVSLTQIMDVDEKNQIIKLNMWVLQEWTDPFFIWHPESYGGVDHMLLPSDALWTPDVVLYSNAGSDWDLSQSSTKLKVYYDGTVVWKPPVIYESTCDINVEFFPFDMQDCRLKMGTWTYHGLHIDLRHLAQKAEAKRLNRIKFDDCEAEINYAVDLSEYVENTEWDLLQVSAKRNIVYYACCPEPYLDITFFLKFRRQSLFYGISLICPCLAISFLTICVFYLPADSQEKITLSISILIALTVFMMMVFDLTPPTSLVVPLITKYLMFTMILVSLSILVSTVVLNVRYRSPHVNKVPDWAKRLFLQTLPGTLCMDRRAPVEDISHSSYHGADCLEDDDDDEKEEEDEERLESMEENDSTDVIDGEVSVHDMARAVRGVRSIARRIRADIRSSTSTEEWKYVALVLDRIFLLSFGLSAIVGTFGIFFQAPTLFDTQKPLRRELVHEYESNLTVVRNCSYRG